MKVAIQGIEGCFHQIAANKYFKYNVDVLPCLTFDELVQNVHDQNGCELGIMAIENSIAGSLLQNYRLLQNNKLKVIGEIYLRIDQHLIAPKGTKLSDIEEIYSHPMAIYQCDQFLKTMNNIRLIEKEDTALSVKNLTNNPNDLTKAAIGSDLAAGIYGMEIIEKAIQTNKNNYTRFLVVSKTYNTDLENTDKSSVYIVVNHTKGSLAKVLDIIAKNNINLSKLQSFPILGSDWQYYFHLDLEYDSYQDFKNATTQIKDYIQDIIILGNYKKGVK
jgi:prephenate dehydratase